MKKFKFFNTLTREIQDFIPLKPNEVSLYTCGPTVYNYAHIGNFRTYMFEDLLSRSLRYFGYHVKHVRPASSIVTVQQFL